MPVRLYLNTALTEGQSVPLSRDQAHYLFGVMRLSEGTELLVFDGLSGEYTATVAQAGKRGGTLQTGARTRALQMPPDLWLLFAPIKKARTDFIVEKAVELGVRAIFPVQTAYTNSERIRQDRLQAHAVEAAEQCGATYPPQVAALRKLSDALAGWPSERTLWFCDEALAGPSSSTMLAAAPGPAAVLIGPEGGFSPQERDRIRAHPQARSLSLGPRILRADTAAVSAVTLWQAQHGDWSDTLRD